MLYRHIQGTFEVCPYKASYTVILKQVVEDGVEIIESEDGTTEEIIKYKTIEVEEQRENFVYDKELFERTLSNSSLPYKDLVYENYTLTEEQYERYEEVRFLPEHFIGDCIRYIEDGTFPQENNHPLRHIQIELEEQKLGQELSEREINETIQGIQLSDLEIQLIELQLGGM